MRALWFLPFAFAGGAEGFALFAPYLIGVLTVLYVVRALRASAARREFSSKRDMANELAMPPGAIAVVQPAL
jgi:hypothetical protein